MTKKSTQKTTKKAKAEQPESKDQQPGGNQPSTGKTSTASSRRVADKKPSSISFSIDDIEAFVATRGSSVASEAKTKKEPVKKKAATAGKPVQIEESTVEKRVLGAASLTDILGFNPAERASAASLEEESIPKKWKKYYKLLIELRDHVSEEIDLHTADTLQHTEDDHAGDRTLEDDAGTDAFDRDFALSLVSSEQDALNEIEEALLRIKQGTYGICEVTGNPIDKNRLAAVPFARYSVEGQIEFEKNMRRRTDRNSGGIFSDAADSPQITSDEDDDDS